MSRFQGAFLWYELMTSDLAAATAFYQAVLGWSARDAGMPGMTYTLFSRQEGAMQQAGALPLPRDGACADARPCWIGYVGVDDVDAVAARIAAAGGAIHRPGTEIPGIGRFAIVGEPQGAVFALFKPACSEPPADAPPAGPGLVGWHELQVPDTAAALSLLTALFGWAPGAVHEIGATGGQYQVISRGDKDIGGLMPNTHPLRPPHWRYYFNVDDVAAVLGRVTGSGGQVMNGPCPVPGGLQMAQCRDPQGAVFALVGPLD
ncbi:MAG: VOC family protein [Azospirillum sp.]|nr:VOC family protein [Azospirillum sp.]